MTLECNVLPQLIKSRHYSWSTTKRYIYLCTLLVFCFYYSPIPNVPDPPCSAYMQEMHVSCCDEYIVDTFITVAFCTRNLLHGYLTNTWQGSSVIL